MMLESRKFAAAVLLMVGSAAALVAIATWGRDSTQLVGFSKTGFSKKTHHNAAVHEHKQARADADGHEHHSGSMMLQSTPGSKKADAEAQPAATPARSCAPLVNSENSFYTAAVRVGTPPQTFDLVADTGSSDLIVPSKQCAICEASQKTTFDHEASSTIIITEMTYELSFGSGDVGVQLVKETVGLDGFVQLKQPTFLMLDSAIDGYPESDFDGIMGLGRPEKSKAGQQSKSVLAAPETSWLSMCLGKLGGASTLRFGSQTPTASGYIPLPSIGDDHIATSLSKLSIGSSHVPDLCGGSSGRCGAIIDTGTTLIVGPAAGLTTLLTAVCENAVGCKAGEEAEFLSDCDNRAHMKDIVFTLGGKTFALKPEHYIMRTHGSDAKLYNKYSKGVSFMQVPAAAKPQKDFCAPAFMVDEMQTAAGEDIWILGIPFLQQYEAQVSFTHTGTNVALAPIPAGGCQACAGEQQLEHASKGAFEGEGYTNLRKVRKVKVMQDEAGFYKL